MINKESKKDLSQGAEIGKQASSCQSAPLENPQGDTLMISVPLKDRNFSFKFMISRACLDGAFPKMHAKLLKSGKDTLTCVKTNEKEELIGYYNPQAIVHFLYFASSLMYKDTALTYKKLTAIENESLAENMLRDLFDLAKEYEAVALQQECAEFILKKVKQDLSHLAHYRDLFSHPSLLKQLNQAVELNSENVWALVVRGYVYLEQNEILFALKDFNTVLQLNPKNAWALAGLQEIYSESDVLDEELSPDQ